MGKRDLTVRADAVRQKHEYACLLTGVPCKLVPVTLRRMIIFPPIWIGSQAVVYLPLAKNPALVFWQYFRMLRPLAVFLIFPLITFAFIIIAIGLQKAIGAQPGGPLSTALATALALITPAIPIAIWILLGRFIERFEFVRLLHSNSKTGTVKIRFSKECYAERASDVLLVYVPESHVSSESKE